MKMAYRGIIDLLGVSDQLREQIELTPLPHYPTLKYFADRSHALGNHRRDLGRNFQRVCR